MSEKPKIKLSELMDMYDIEGDEGYSIDKVNPKNIDKKGLQIESKIDYYDHADKLEEQLEEDFVAD